MTYQETEFDTQVRLMQNQAEEWLAREMPSVADLEDIPLNELINLAHLLSQRDDAQRLGLIYKRALELAISNTCLSSHHASRGGICHTCGEYMAALVVKAELQEDTRQCLAENQ